MTAATDGPDFAQSNLRQLVNRTPYAFQNKLHKADLCFEAVTGDSRILIKYQKAAALLIEDRCFMILPLFYACCA
jgi:hypothetical protein